MSLFPFSKPKLLTTLFRQGGDVLAGVKDTATRVSDHVGALWQLLLVELQEHLQFQFRRAVAILLGLVLLFFGYLLLCAFSCTALAVWTGSWLLAIGCVCVLHIVVGLVCLLVGVRSKPGPIAPAVRQELQNDLQCLKLLFNSESKKS